MKEGGERSEIMSVHLFHMQTFFGHLGTISLCILPLFLSYFLYLYALNINRMRGVSETMQESMLFDTIHLTEGRTVACWGIKTILYLPTFVQIVIPIKEVFRFYVLGYGLLNDF